MATFVAAIALCAFIIDRIIASLMFVTSWIQTSRDPSRKGLARRKEQKQKLLYFLLSGGLAVVALLLVSGLRLDLRGLGNVPAWLSPILTWLVLVAGAERVSAFVGVGSDAKPAEESSETREVRVVGTLSVDPETAARIVEGAERR